MLFPVVEDGFVIGGHDKLRAVLLMKYVSDKRCGIIFGLTKMLYFSRFSMAVHFLRSSESEISFASGDKLE